MLKNIFYKRMIVVLLAGIIVLGVYLTIKLKSTTKQPTNQAAQDLKLVQIDPLAERVETTFTTTGILFTFDDNIDANTARVSIEPEIGILSQQSINNSKTLVVRPIEEWKENISYTINVAPGLKSRDGNKVLKNEITKKFSLTIPKNLDIMSY
jgi:hypothetical protein